MDQKDAIKKLQNDALKEMIALNRFEKLQKDRRKLEEQERKAKKELIQIQNRKEENHSIYLLTCLRAINLNPINDRVIILGTLALLQEKIKNSRASTEIDNAIVKYKDLIAKGIINDAGFEESKWDKAEDEE